MQYPSEVALKEWMGIDSWRNLSKEKFLQFLNALPEVDKEVALHLVGQIPEITACAKVVLEDTAKAYAGILDSNEHSMEMVHRLDTEALATLRNELDKDLAPEERLRVLDDLRDVLIRWHRKDSENKEFLSAQFDKVLGAAALFAVSIFAVMFVAGKSGGMLGGFSRRIAD